MLCRVHLQSRLRLQRFGTSSRHDPELGIVGRVRTIAVGSTRRRLSFFLMVLCYSRRMYLEFTVSQKMEFFLACHENAFAAFGGCPKPDHGRQPQVGGVAAPGRCRPGVQSEVPGLLPPLGLRDQPLQRAQRQREGAR